MAVPVEDLSLLGLLGRIEEIETLKRWAHDGEAEKATIASEGAAKKAIVGLLDDASCGLSTDEKSRAREFLLVQFKAVDPHDKHAAARKDKFSALLRSVESAPSKDEPAHVKRARDALKRVQREYKDAREIYEKWERGKMMFKTNDELKAMQKNHDDLKKCLEATTGFIDEMLSLKCSDARPPALPGGQVAPRPKAKGGSVRAVKLDPAVHVGDGGYPGYPNVRNYPNSSSAVMRNAQMIAEVRAENLGAHGASLGPYDLLQDAWQPEVAAMVPPSKPSKPPKVKEQPAEDTETVVLSYTCACKAVAEICGISVDKARDMAESSSDFKRHLSYDQWEQVKERATAIEKEQKEFERLKEQRKKDNALAKITEKQGPKVVERPSAPAVAKISAATKAAGKAKPAPKTKSPMPKKAGVALVQANRFGGLGDSDDDDEGGWTTVK